MDFIDAIIERLEKESIEERTEAVEELVIVGIAFGVLHDVGDLLLRGYLDYLRDKRAASGDPEVKARLEEVIDRLTGDLRRRIAHVMLKMMQHGGPRLPIDIDWLRLEAELDRLRERLRRLEEASKPKDK